MYTWELDFSNVFFLLVLIMKLVCGMYAFDLHLLSRSDQSIGDLSNGTQTGAACDA